MFHFSLTFQCLPLVTMSGQDKSEKLTLSSCFNCRFSFPQTDVLCSLAHISAFNWHLISRQLICMWCTSALWHTAVILWPDQGLQIWKHAVRICPTKHFCVSFCSPPDKSQGVEPTLGEGFRLLWCDPADTPAEGVSKTWLCRGVIFTAQPQDSCIGITNSQQTAACEGAQVV